MKKNSVENLFPNLVSEWHPEMNGDLSPSKFSKGSDKKIWWLCPNGHEYECAIYYRTSGRGCPQCSRKRPSREYCLETINPSLAKEWHPKKNAPLKPANVLPRSSKKVWWLCPKGHEYESVINSRAKGTGCTFCSGKRAYSENCLEKLFHEVAKEWHPTKNSPLKPDEVTAKSGKKVFWLCPVGHEYESFIYSRTSGRGCPYCSGRRASQKYNLAVKYKAVSKEWHPSKNGALTPFDVTPGAGKKVFWLCSAGHEYESVINKRASGGVCPFCSGRKVCYETSLKSTHSVLCKQWDSYKNLNLTPEQVSKGSDRKVFWVCDTGHSYKSSISSRTSGRGCPICSGHKASIDNCLATIKPELAKEWDTVRNIDITPFDVTPGSAKKVFWVCPTGHVYDSVISSRTAGRGCPHCSGNRINKSNCLAAKKTSLAAELHPTKNGNLTAWDLMPATSKKVWWICKRKHAYKAAVNSRKKGSGCRHCKNGTSLPEKRVYSEILSIFPDTLWMDRTNGIEFDIYIPSLKVAVEYDGVYYHKNKRKLDKLKNKKADDLGIRLIRVREPGLRKIIDADISLDGSDLSKCDLNNLVVEIHKYIDVNNKHSKRALQYLNCRNFKNESHFLKIMATDMPFERSIASCPNAMKLWDFDSEIDPESISKHSKRVITWVCDKNHRFESSITCRARFNPTCPVCTSLEIRYPDIAKEWHPNKNDCLTPRKVKPQSNKKVWWLCPKGHEYQAYIANRFKGFGCPHCSGRSKFVLSQT